MTATSMSRSRVPGPRLGATPAKAQAARLSYMMPRVPSIGSTMTRRSASCSEAPRGKAAVLSCPCSLRSPSATSTSGTSRLHRSKNSSMAGSMTASMR